MALYFGILLITGLFPSVYEENRLNRLNLAKSFTTAR